MYKIRLPQELHSILSALEEKGFEAYLVGGAARDYLLGLEVCDFDIATSARPADILDVFKDFNINKDGIEYGSLKIFAEENRYEITTFRKDLKYSDHRRPDAVLFADSLTEDLTRRDFTINAMAFDKSGRLFDPLNAEQDLKAGLIRTVAPPEISFEEDALRILRALRFASQLGFKIEEKTKKSIFDKQKLLSCVSAVRATDELTKILCGDYVIPVLREYREPIAVLIPELSASFDFDQYNPHHEFDVWEHTIAAIHYSSKDPLTRWAALMHDIAKPACCIRDEKGIGHFKGHAKAGEEMAGDILRRFRFSSDDASVVRSLIKNHYPIPALSKKSVKRALMKLGYDNFLKLLSLIRADNISKKKIPDSADTELLTEHLSGLESLADEIIAENECFSLRSLDINGFDIIKLGYKNREVGEVLRFALNAVIDEYVENKKPSIIKFIKENY